MRMNGCVYVYRILFYFIVLYCIVLYILHCIVVLYFLGTNGINLACYVIMSYLTIELKLSLIVFMGTAPYLPCFSFFLALWSVCMLEVSTSISRPVVF
jgi:hypothetical protein